MRIALCLSSRIQDFHRRFKLVWIDLSIPVHQHVIIQAISINSNNNHNNNYSIIILIFLVHNWILLINNNDLLPIPWNQIVSVKHLHRQIRAQQTNQILPSSMSKVFPHRVGIVNDYSIYSVSMAMYHVYVIE